MAKMSTLLKSYGFNSDTQYFEMILESRLNGQNQQAKDQFNILSHDYKGKFLKYILYSQVPPKLAGYLEFFIREL